MLNRRSMLAGLSGAVVATGCSVPVTRHKPIKPDLLKGYRGLASTPYFELNERGEPILTQKMLEELPKGVDFHTHLGHAFMFSPSIDYHKSTDRVSYYVDCDAYDPPCDYNLNDYLNKIADHEMLSDMEAKLLTTVVPGGSDAAKTHTIPNIIYEMDHNSIDRSVLLTVMPRLPFRNNQTMEWLRTLQESPYKDRFVLFGAVDPRNSGAVAQLREFAKLGVRGLKLHPTMQQIAPDDQSAMEVYEECEKLNIPVFFHAGRAGIEPKYSRQFAEMKRYIAPVREFPKVKFVFGHAGARDWREAMALAKFHENVFLEIEGQGVVELKTIIGTNGSERLLFGSDWPFYPIAATMGRVLIATDGDKTARDNIIAYNARKIIGE